jgi:hypothetical protein
MKLSRQDAARVKKLTAEVLALRNQIHDIEQPYHQSAGAAMVGLCFKTRNNYSCPEKPSDYWQLYVKVQSTDEHGHLKCLKFEVDKDGNVSVRKDQFYHPHSLDSYLTISPDEFQREFAKMLKHTEKMNG